jgi:hypothetical protein
MSRDAKLKKQEMPLQRLQWLSFSTDEPLQGLKATPCNGGFRFAIVVITAAQRFVVAAIFAKIHREFEEHDSNVEMDDSAAEKAVATFAARIVQGVAGVAGAADADSALTPLNRWVSARSSKTSGRRSGLPAWNRRPRTRFWLVF